jgi:hypothetical protein
MLIDNLATEEAESLPNSVIMQQWRFTLLDDAFFFLNQAKSLSSTPTARAAKERYIRSSVMLSWQALEDAAKDVLHRSSTPPFPKKFSERLKLALALMGHSQAFDPILYKERYLLRNDVVHVNAGSAHPTLRDAEAMFIYAKSMICSLIPPCDRLEIRIEPF